MTVARRRVSRRGCREGREGAMYRPVEQRVEACAHSATGEAKVE